MRGRDIAAAAIAVLFIVACSALDPQVGPPAALCVDADSNPAQPVSFAEDIRPLMNRSNADPMGHGCMHCHYSTQPSHICLDTIGLDLSTLGALRRGGLTSATTIAIPGKPCESALVQKLQGDYFTGLQMPKDGPPFWSPQEIQLVIDWIAEGALGSDDE